MCPLNEPTDKETRALLGLEASVRRSLGGLMPLGLKKWGTHGMSGKEALSRYQRRNLTKAPHEETGTSWRNLGGGTEARGPLEQWAPAWRVALSSIPWPGRRDTWWRWSLALEGLEWHYTARRKAQCPPRETSAEATRIASRLLPVDPLSPRTLPLDSRGVSLQKRGNSSSDKP